MTLYDDMVESWHNFDPKIASLTLVGVARITSRTYHSWMNKNRISILKLYCVSQFARNYVYISFSK